MSNDSIKTDLPGVTLDSTSKVPHEPTFTPPTISTDFPDTKAGSAPANAQAFLSKVSAKYEAENLATHTPAPKSVDGDDTSKWRGGNTGN
jgi:hypothetical protein